MNNDYLYATLSVNDAEYTNEAGIYKIRIDDITDVKDGDTQVSDIFISPNPASDKLIISNIPDGSVIYEVFDIFGKRVLSTTSLQNTPQEGNWEIDVSKLTPGIYFIKIGTQPPLKFVKI